MLLAGMAALTAAAAQEARAPQLPTAETPAWPSSPYHNRVDGDGNVIPCRCRFDGREFRLGELVCMATPEGVVLARCDLMLNNTSWVPTTTPCVVGLGTVRAGMLARVGLPEHRSPVDEQSRPALRDAPTLERAMNDEGLALPARPPIVTGLQPTSWPVHPWPRRPPS